MHKPLSKVLERLNSLEKEYSGIVQELIAILPSEVSVTDEVSKWAAGERLIVEHLVESLLNIEKKDKVEARPLRGLYDVMVSRYRTLEAYEPKLAEAQRILVPILQSKFPDEIQRKWEF